MTLFPAKHRIIVDSGKGGVGKTTVAAAIGMGLAARGHNTLIIDLDFHGPSLGALLNLPQLTVTGGEHNPRIQPAQVAPKLHAVSVAQFIHPDSPVTWRSGSVEGFMMFLAARLDTKDADYIIFDMPPGTGDIKGITHQHVRPDGAIVVTTGSPLAHADTTRAVRFAQRHGVHALGVVENMSQRDGVRLFGEEKDTIAFTGTLSYDNQFGKQWAPKYLGSLAFEANPAALAANDSFKGVLDAAEDCNVEFETTGDPEFRRLSLP